MVEHPIASDSAILIQPPEGRIRLVGADLLERAAARLVCTRGRPDPRAARRFLKDAAETAIPLDRFWVWVEPAGEVDAAVLTVCSPGRTAILYASRPFGLGRVEKVVACLQAACRSLEDAGVVVAQALIDPGQRAERKVFQEAGFRVLANLTYLERALERRPIPPRSSWPNGALTETYSDMNHADFRSALEATYQDTLDCPALTGVRTSEEILAGHKATGEFDPGLWTLLRLQGRPSGILLMNPSPRLGTIELVYLGLARDARKRGYGRFLLEHGIRQASGRSETAMTLAVDDRNEPAIRLYRRAGFRRVLRRVAMTRTLQGESHGA